MEFTSFPGSGHYPFLLDFKRAELYWDRVSHSSKLLFSNIYAMGLPGRVQCHAACARVPSPVTTRDSDMPDGKCPDRPTRFGATRKHLHARFSRFRRENHASCKARRSAGWFAYHAVARSGARSGFRAARAAEVQRRRQGDSISASHRPGQARPLSSFTDCLPRGRVVT